MLNDELIAQLALGKVATMLTSAFIAIVILLFFGEITPMSLAYSHADTWAKTIATPLYFWRKILLPITTCAGYLCGKILNALGKKTQKPLNSAEFLTYLDSCVEKGAFARSQANLLKETFELREKQVAEVMRPRVNLNYVLESDSPETVSQKIRAGNQAFLLVCKNNIDDAERLLDVLRFFRLSPDQRSNWLHSSAVLSQVPFLPVQTTLSKALTALREKGLSAAFAADEYGGLCGIISIQDIYSEVAGKSVELSEEHTEFFNLTQGQWIFNGNCHLDVVREQSDWTDCNADETYKAITLSGLFTEICGYIPKRGESVRLGNYTMLALTVDKNHIRRILVRFSPEKEPDNI